MGAIVADSDGVVYDNGSVYLDSITYVKLENDEYLDEFTVEVEDVLDLMDIDSYFEIKGGEWILLTNLKIFMWKEHTAQETRISGHFHDFR